MDFIAILAQHLEAQGYAVFTDPPPLSPELHIHHPNRYQHINVRINGTTIILSHLHLRNSDLATKYEFDLNDPKSLQKLETKLFAILKPVNEHLLSP